MLPTMLSRGHMGKNKENHPWANTPLRKPATIKPERHRASTRAYNKLVSILETQGLNTWDARIKARQVLGYKPTTFDKAK